MDFLTYYQQTVEKITGHLYTEEARMMWRLAENWLPYNGRMCEVGCDMGRSTSIWAYWVRAKQAKLVVVDPFCWSTMPETFTWNMELAGYNEKRDYFLEKKYSHDFAAESPDEFFDLVFIDADHSAPGIKLDCDVWPAKVRPGGVLVFHDYDNPTHPEMKPTIDKAMLGWEMIRRQETLIAFRKPSE